MMCTAEIAEDVSTGILEELFFKYLLCAQLVIPFANISISYNSMVTFNYTINVFY